MNYTNIYREESSLEKEVITLIKEKLEPLLEENENLLGLLPMARREETFLIFTKYRILYLVVPDFLENGRFYSYPYETIKSLIIKERTSKPSQFEGDLWFLMDYTSGEIIFAEVFPFDSMDYVKEQMKAIPAFNEIPMATKTYGSNKFGRVVHDPELVLDNSTKRNMAFVLIAILLVVALVARSL